MYRGKYVFISSVILLATGIVMIYSASNVWAAEKLGDKYFFVIRQLLFGIIGLLSMLFVSKINPRIYRENATKILVASIVLLIMVLIPGIGVVRGGARSWIGLGQFTLQPSEFAKIAIIMFVSKYLAKIGDEQGNDKFQKYVPILSILFIMFGLIMLQPDFGSGTVLVLTVLLMIYISGIGYRYIYIGLVVGLFSVAAMVITAPYRLKRITSFVNPWEDPLGSGFQIIQSLYAIVPGGILGYGIFKSKQKFFYLPEPQTDFIFSIITEEIGLIGIIFIFMVYMMLFYNGLMIGIKTKELFLKYLAIGLTVLVFIQFAINISVVIGLIPVTGITLPFLSYGGSSLVILLTSMGIIISIDRVEVEN